MAAVYPNLSALQGQVSQNIGNQLNGQLSPGTLSTLQNQAARLGVSGLGMPGSGISNRAALALLGTSAETQSNAGITNFLNTLRGYSGAITPTSGELLGQQTAREQMGTQEGIAGADLAEKAREFDIQTWLQNQQFYAGLGPSYMQAAGSYLNWL